MIDKKLYKKCTKCKKIRILKEFNKNSQFGSGLNSVCKYCKNKDTKKYYIKYPWKRKLYSIRERCNNTNNSHYKYYGERGIKCKITEEELKNLWFRDNAYNLEYPSIDRINPDGHYEYNNCRFIEFSKNCSERNSRILKKPIVQYSLDGQFIREWESAIQIKRELGFDQSSIGKCCNFKQKTAYNFIWKFKNVK